MPPKKGDQPKAAKIAVDKTFGMKNKNKSAKVQQQVRIIQQQEAQKGQNKEAEAKRKEKEALAARRAAEQKKKEELNALFQEVEIVQAKVPFGVDPKSILCAFHKAGKCTKGNKCKFSHDLSVGRKAEKASVYADQRDGEGSKKDDTMDKWDDAKLREVVSAKGNPQTTTDIVCKHFIDAVERGTYGWFWTCPDGGDTCKYRHALPPGFVLKSQKKKEDEAAKANEISLEDFLEVARHKLDQSKLTPITPESFAIWKRTRLDKRDAEASAVQAAKEAQANMGKSKGMSGRDLFSFNPNMFDEEDEESDGEDEWDILEFRKQAEKEREEKEAERIRLLEAEMGATSLRGAS